MTRLERLKALADGTRYSVWAPCGKTDLAALIAVAEAAVVLLGALANEDDPASPLAVDTAMQRLHAALAKLQEEA